MATKAPAKDETEISPAARAAWADANRNFAWADAHRDEIKRHAGQWLCIADGQIVAADADHDRFMELLRLGQWQGSGRAPYVLYVPTAEDLADFHPFVHVSR